MKCSVLQLDDVPDSRVTSGTFRGKETHNNMDTSFTTKVQHICYVIKMSNCIHTTSAGPSPKYVSVAHMFISFYYAQIISF